MTVEWNWIITVSTPLSISKDTWIKVFFFFITSEVSLGSLKSQGGLEFDPETKPLAQQAGWGGATDGT